MVRDQQGRFLWNYKDLCSYVEVLLAIFSTAIVEVTILECMELLDKIIMPMPSWLIVWKCDELIGP